MGILVLLLARPLDTKSSVDDYIFRRKFRRFGRLNIGETREPKLVAPQGTRVMSHANESSGTPVQPALADLLARYLQRQAAAQAAGFASPDMDGEVVPFEAVPVQPVDPRLAWQEALAVIAYFRPNTDCPTGQVPPDWSTLVAVHEPEVALAFCLGNFPQLMRNVQPLLQRANLGKLRPSATRSLAVPALLAWTAEQNEYPQILLAIGALRLARQFDRAAELLQEHQANVPAEWQAVWANEEAALLWQRGRAGEAAALWQSLPESVPVLFNRGMAALFLEQPAEARAQLSRAVAQLPEDSSWHHLGRLYLALAEMRG